MKKIILFLLGVFCACQCYSQDEFFGNSNGLFLAGSTDFANANGGTLGIHLKSGVSLSGTLAKSYDLILKGVNLGYIISNTNSIEGTKGLVGISYATIERDYQFASFSAGLNRVFLSDTQCPFSLGSVLSISSIFGGLSSALNLDLVTGYTQSFFAKSPVYPVLGVTYTLPLNKTYYESRDGSFLFHIGLNIRLSPIDNNEKKE